MQKISENGIALIRRFESFKANPYLCPAGVATIGYGTTVYPNGTKVTLKDAPISEEKAKKYLCFFCDFEIRKKIENRIKRELTQNQFDAICSFVYNCGISETLFLMIEKNDPNLKTWWTSHYITAKGVKLKGLVNRRQAECDLYFS